MSYRLSSSKIGSPALMIMGALLWQPALGATLGQLQVNSRIGQSLDARVRINAHADEALGRECISANIYDGGDDGYLRRAFIEFSADKGGGGWLLINSDGTLNEPIAKLSLRLRCIDGGEVRRDYVFLLDPPQDRAVPLDVAPPLARSSNEVPVMGGSVPSAMARNGASFRADGDNPLTAYGGQWVSKSGDSYASIAAQIYPGQQNAQRTLIRQLRQLNPQLPLRSKEPLVDGVPLRLPEKLAAPKTTTKPATKPVPAAAQLPTPVPASSATVQPTAPAPQGSLKLSGTIAPEAPASASGASGTSELEALKTHEHELMDQAAEQLARLHEAQNRIDKLEKRLAWLDGEMLRRDAARAAASQEQNRSEWKGLALAALLGAGLAGGLAWLLGSIGKRRAAVQTQAATIAAALNDEQEALPWHQQTIVEPPVEMPGTPQGVRAMAASPTHFDTPGHSPQESDMDVFILNSAASEAAVLAAHGQYDRAIAMLEDEIQTYPTSVVNWMQLLELLHSHRDAERFLSLARDFRQRFASEALWEKVRQMGLVLLPDEPLFDLQQTAFGHGNDDFNSVLDAGIAAAPSPSREHLAEPLAFELDRSITAVGKPEHLDLIDIPGVTDNQADAAKAADAAPASPMEQARRLIASGDREAGAAILEDILMHGNQEEKLAAADLLVRLTSPS